MKTLKCVKVGIRFSDHFPGERFSFASYHGAEMNQGVLQTDVPGRKPTNIIATSDGCRATEEVGWDISVE